VGIQPRVTGLAQGVAGGYARVDGHGLGAPTVKDGHDRVEDVVIARVRDLVIQRFQIAQHTAQQRHATRLCRQIRRGAQPVQQRADQAVHLGTTLLV
jgi:hypothetical protein